MGHTMDRRDFLKAGLGAVVAGAAGLDPALAGDLPSAASQGLLLSDNGPIYEAGPSPSLNLTDEVTLEAWVKASPMPGVGGRILDKSPAGTSDGYELDTYPGNSLRMITLNGAVSNDAKLADDHWTHVVGVYSSTKKIEALYIDGRQAASRTDGEFPALSLTQIPLRVGADNNGENRFQGRILRAAVYNRALTADEIADRGKAGVAAPPGLKGVIGEWTFPAVPTKTIQPVSGALALRLNGAGIDLGEEAPAPTGPLLLWYRRPAQQWLEALPIGNGRVGAMVYGGVLQEDIQLNEGTVWAGGPHDYANPDGLAALPTIRQLVFDDKWREAENLINKSFMGRPAGQLQYQTVGRLILGLPMAASASHYLRQLDLDTAVTSVSYVADGVTYSREVFASAADGIIAIRLTADQPGKISLTGDYASPQRTKTRTDGDNRLMLDGISGDSQGIPGSVKFCAVAHFRSEGGTVKGTGKQIVVTGADALTILISIGTSYENYKDVSGDPLTKALRPLEPALQKSYSDLRIAHIADYQQLFHRLSLDLGRPDGEPKPTDERIKTFKEGKDPALATLHCQYGRYLMISGSRLGGQPLTLQGLWNDSMNPPWGSKYTDNINTEMNYWPTSPGNLTECYAPLFSMLGDLVESGARTAKVQYGAGGWVCHHNTDGWRGTAPVDYAGPGMWPSGGSWLCKNFWDHYEFTGDTAALAAHYPVMKGAAEFFLDTLVEEPKHHWLVTNPSVSPEISHHPGVSVCAGPTMDMQILRDLFGACARASEILDKDPEFRAKVRATRERLAPMQIGALGQLQEWLEDWDPQEPDKHNRHVSHMYGLFPSNQITRRGTPDLFAAAKKSLELRGDMATGWSLAWKINLWARLEDGDHAYKLMTDLLTPERTAPNLFDLHPPFQIDGNFGAASGVLEMLVGSHTGEIHFLPALPSAWPNGSVKGVLARGGFSIDMDWAAGKLTKAVIHSSLSGPCKLRLDEQTATIPTKAGKKYEIDGTLKVVLPA